MSQLTGLEEFQHAEEILTVATVLLFFLYHQGALSVHSSCLWTSENSTFSVYASSLMKAVGCVQLVLPTGHRILTQRLTYWLLVPA